MEEISFDDLKKIAKEIELTDYEQYISMPVDERLKLGKEILAGIESRDKNKKEE